ncbi:MAG: acyl-CoA dehydrogenase [Pseudonocardiales bacterium]|nr:MAG: acyl-CoA dehydrogenase [Pseudonocardiales bacterium]
MQDAVVTGLDGSERVGVVAARFADLIDRDQLAVPLPGRGHTAQRWRALAELAADDLDLGRLAEAHLDALTILAELHGPASAQSPEPLPGQRWAVWAAEPPNGRVDAECHPDGRWRLSGTKRWCSGAHACTHALVTAHAADGGRLFAVDLSEPGVRPGLGGWKGLGMAGSGTETVEFDAVPAAAIGAPRAYLDRVGFWHGAIGVAACWYGGAVAVGRQLWEAARGGGLDPHARAHLGAVDTALTAAGSVLREAAAAVDRGPDPATSDLPSMQLAQRRALRVRAVVEAAATQTIERVGRALGPRPLATDATHSRRIADLIVYLRQSHAERDLAALGDLAAGADSWQSW